MKTLCFWSFVSTISGAGAGTYLPPWLLGMFSCISQFPLFALARMGLCQLCPGLFALCGRAQAVLSSLEPEHSPDTSSSWSDSGLLTNVSILHFTAVYRIFPGDSWLLYWAQSKAVNPAFPVSCPHGQQATQTAASKTLLGPLSCAWWHLKLPEEPARKADGSSAVCPHFGLPLQQYSWRQQGGTKFFLSWAERKRGIL